MSCHGAGGREKRTERERERKKEGPPGAPACFSPLFTMCCHPVVRRCTSFTNPPITPSFSFSFSCPRRGGADDGLQCNDNLRDGDEGSRLLVRVTLLSAELHLLLRGGLPTLDPPQFRPPYVVPHPHTGESNRPRAKEVLNHFLTLCSHLMLTWN